MSNQEIMASLEVATADRPDWQVLQPLLADQSVGVHLAVLVEPYLTYLLEGQKTIESRFSKHRIAPYRCVAIGDLVLLKWGKIVGAFQASSVTYYDYDAELLGAIRHDHAEAICAEDNAFWDAQATKQHATLIGVSKVSRLSPVAVPKRDARGWVTLRSSAQSSKYSTAD